VNILHVYEKQKASEVSNEFFWVTAYVQVAPHNIIQISKIASKSYFDEMFSETATQLKFSYPYLMSVTASLIMTSMILSNYEDIIRRLAAFCAHNDIQLLPMRKEAFTDFVMQKIPKHNSFVLPENFPIKSKCSSDDNMVDITFKTPIKSIYSKFEVIFWRLY